MRNRIKKLIAVTLCVGLTAGMAMGCSTKKKEKKEDSKREITFMIPDWGAPGDKLLSEFTKKTGIDVVVNVVSWDDIRDKVAIAASGGSSAADVVEVDWSWAGEFNAANWLEPIELPDEEKSDMPTIDTFTIDGKILAVPYANDYRLSYYNKENFKAAGIEKEPATWDEAYEDAKTLKKTGVMEYPFVIPLNAEESTTTSLIWLAYTMNGIVFNDDGTLNKESVMAALEYEDKLLKDNLIDPADKSSSGMDAYRRILSGGASFMTGPTSFVARSNNEKECSVIGQIEPILVPGSTEKAKHTMALPEAIGVTKFSKNKEDAKTFVKWYTSPETQKALFDKNSTIPTHNTVLQNLIEAGKIKNSGAMLEEAKRIASPFPKGVPSYYNEMSNAIYNAVNKMALGQLNVKQAFDEMNSKVTELAGSK